MASFRRFRRRIRGWLGARIHPRIPFVHHVDYRRGLTGVPMDALRGERVLSWLVDEGWIRPRALVEPRPASLENLQRVHPAEYLRTLEDPAEVGRIMGLPLTPEEARAALAVQRLAAGGTIQATRLALRSRGVAFHLGGGFHHASPTRGTGFCLLNDVAVAVARLRARGYAAPVLVVDLDLHDGNGTRRAFEGDASVYTYSLHNAHWEEPEAVADTSIAFGSGIEDRAYLALLRETLPPVFEAHRPELVVYVAGVDPAAEDAYGDGRMTAPGLLERDRTVAGLAREAGAAMAVVLAGGYGGSAWRPTARFAAWLLTGRIEEPPDEVRAALDRAELDRGRAPAVPGGREPAGTGARDPFAWSLGPADLAALGGVEGNEPLLLGRWSRGRVERELERFGILAQVRNRGYPDPLVELRASTGLGPVVRVWGEPGRRHLLVELRVEPDRTSLPGHSLLRVEWLLLQDPKGTFTARRPPLPGQEYPGLGCLADVVAFLVTLCREVEFDGILFRTGHRHMGRLARRHARFLTPEDARRFEDPEEQEEFSMVIPVGEAPGGTGETPPAPAGTLEP